MKLLRSMYNVQLEDLELALYDDYALSCVLSGTDAML